MKAILMIVMLMGVTCLVSGCAGVSEFTSEPTGASVSLNGTPIGATPFSYEVKDIMGMNSLYEFTAEKTGFSRDTKTFREKGLNDAKATIPPRIHFVLQPIQPMPAEKPKQQGSENALPLTPPPPRSLAPF